MQLAQRRVISGAAPSRARCVRVCARQQGSMGQAAAAIAAAVVLQATPALAGVVLEQPALKKVFQEDGSARPAAAAAAPKAKAAKKAVSSESSGGIAPQSIALPAALVVVGGGAFALSNVDEGFGEFMRTAAVKDSAETGAGYETDIKGGALATSKPKTSGKKGGK